MRSYDRLRGRTSRRGLATVELAIVLPVLMLMLFGIMEMGLLFKDVLMLQQGVREGGRTGALGSVPTQVSSVVTSSAASLDSTKLTVTSQYRTWNGTTWDSWVTLGTSGTTNNAPSGSQIKVSAAYDHMLVTGGLFSFIATDTNKTKVTINASSVVRRE
jgi:Flp pilus assembly protein TadG